MCVRTVSPLTRLGSNSDLTRGLRPGLTALPPLRGWYQDISGIVIHKNIAHEDIARETL